MERPGAQPGPRTDERRSLLARYWRTNLLIMALLLCGWAAAGLGAGVLAADWLNAYRLPGTGFPLGFWMAHQGSILAFVGLILLYCLLMNLLDRKHHGEIARLRDRGEW